MHPDQLYRIAFFFSGLIFYPILGLCVAFTVVAAVSGFTRICRLHAQEYLYLLFVVVFCWKLVRSAWRTVTRQGWRFGLIDWFLLLVWIELGFVLAVLVLFIAASSGDLSFAPVGLGG